jgi:DNA-binding response OmpR family regulator
MSHIVVIEQDQLMRGLLLEWLSAEGYVVDTAAHEADDTIEDADLLIVDVLSPRCDGRNRLRALKRAHPGTPLIAISGQFRPGTAGMSSIAETLGVRQIIAKPFTRHDLLSVVRSVISASG